MPFIQKKFLSLFSLLYLISLFTVGQSRVYSGKVIDAKTKKPLAFVSVLIVGQTKGTQTDIDGKFVLAAAANKAENLRFAFVGYETQESTLASGANNVVELKERMVEIKEVLVYAGENPAHRIIKKAIANRSINDPEKKTSFRYNSYNKFIFTAVNDSVRKAYPMSTADSIKNAKKHINRDSLNLVRERQRTRLDSLVEKQHIFMMESVTQRDFLFPDLSKETILASKVSGLSRPQFLLVASQFQSFSFYKDYIDLLDKKFLSPLSVNSYNNYFFNIEDTLYQNTDTVFVISYLPKKGKNFDALKGLIYINSAGFAIQNVIAEPLESLYFGIKIQQKYEQIENSYWFPTQLNTDLDFKGSISVNGGRLIGIGRTYLRDINIGVKMEKKKFDAIAVDYDKNLIKNSDSLLKKYRIDSLQEKEKRTYVVMDSIGKKEKFDEKVKLFSIISDGYIPWGYVQFDWRKIIAGYNDYEGLRIGAAVASSKKFSKYFSLSTYVAVGTKDADVKYGFGLDVPIHIKKQIAFSVQYKNDISESGLVSFEGSKPQQFENYRMLVVNRFDKIESFEGQLSFRMTNYLKTSIKIKQTLSKVIGNYNFGVSAQNEFLFNEAGFTLRYAYLEKFISQANKLISLGTKYPIVYFQYTFGQESLAANSETYHKFDLKVGNTYTIRGLGESSFNLNVGKIIGNTPYAISYNARANRGNQLSLVSNNNFETMYSNEFLSSEYASLFLTHNFGKLLLKTAHFQPGFSVVSNMTLGKLGNKVEHNGIIFSTLEKGYFESGLIISDLWRMKSNVYTSGFGVGCYYRYGSYAFNDPIDNFAVKLDFRISF